MSITMSLSTSSVDFSTRDYSHNKNQEPLPTLSSLTGYQSVLYTEQIEPLSSQQTLSCPLCTSSKSSTSTFPNSDSEEDSAALDTTSFSTAPRSQQRTYQVPPPASQSKKQQFFNKFATLIKKIKH